MIEILLQNMDFYGQGCPRLGQNEVCDEPGNIYLHQNKPHTQLDFTCLNRMYTENMLCDVILVAENVEIPAHKLILAAGSAFFYWKFSNDRKFGLINRIEIENMTHETLSTILGYLYKSEILITEMNVEKILEAAYKFCMKDLQEACRLFLKNNLSVSNCLSTENVARRTHCQELISTVGDFLIVNSADIMRFEKYLGLTYEAFSDLISNDVLCAAEKDVLEYVIRWVRADVKYRKDYIFALMKQVRFPLIPQNHFIRRLEEEHWLKSDPKYYPFLIDIIKSHTLGQPQCMPSIRGQTSKLLVVVGVTNWHLGELSWEMYDFQKEIWLNWPETLNIRCGGIPRVAIHGSRIYCIHNSKLKSLDISNPTQTEWSTHSPLLGNREYLSLAVFKNSIYAVGGSYNKQGQATVEMYDIISRRWKKMANMSEAKRSVGLGIFNGNLYAVGGRKSTQFGVMDCNSVEYYKDDTNLWYTIPKMSIERSGSGVAALGNELYVVGGMANTEFCNQVDVFNPDECSWRRLPDMNIARSGPGVIAVNNKLYVIGGYNDSGVLKSIEVYDPVNDSWSMLSSSMRTGKCFVAVDLIEKTKISTYGDAGEHSF